MLFIQHREVTAKANIDLTITYRDIIDGHTWLRSEVLLENVGKTKLRADEIEARLQIIEPLDNIIIKKIDARESIVDAKFNMVMWPEMARRNVNINLELEPGEKDKLPFEFVMPSEWQTIKLYVFVNNKYSHNLGWSATAIFSRDLRP